MYKAILGADIGSDNGIFDWGTHATVDEAIEAMNIPTHCLYGKEVRDQETNALVALGE